MRTTLPRESSEIGFTPSQKASKGNNTTHHTSGRSRRRSCVSYRRGFKPGGNQHERRMPDQRSIQYRPHRLRPGVPATVLKPDPASAPTSDGTFVDVRIRRSRAGLRDQTSQTARSVDSPMASTIAAIRGWQHEKRRTRTEVRVRRIHSRAALRTRRESTTESNARYSSDWAAYSSS